MVNVYVLPLSSSLIGGDGLLDALGANERHFGCLSLTAFCLFPFPDWKIFNMVVKLHKVEGILSLMLMLTGYDRSMIRWYLSN